MAAKQLHEYKDQFTLDGRLKPQPYVTKRKVEAVKELTEAAFRGNREAKGRLEEVMTSSDAIFNWTHLLNVNFLPQYDALEPTWAQIAGRRTVPDFRPAVLYSLVSRWDGVEREGGDPSPNAAPHGIAPTVPEAAPYPYAYMAGEESESAGISKFGFKTDFTFEAFINDSIGFIQALPSEMLNVISDTIDYRVYKALINGVDSSVEIAGGVTPDGVTVPAKAALSRQALARAIYELSQRKINNRYVKVTGGYNLIVPIGQAEYVRFWLNQSIAAVEDGSLTLTVTGYNPLASVDVVESEWVSGSAWYLLPKPGATRRPVLEWGTLVGHETPELRVHGNTGTLIGGGQIGPFEGNFDNDSAEFRVRGIGDGILWSKQLVVWSDGTGGN